MFILCVSLASCFKEIPTTEAVLPQEKMVQVLTDIHLAESMLSEIKHRPTQDSLAIAYYAHIMALHEIDAEQFDQSMNAYFTNPSLMDSLYSCLLYTSPSPRD